MQRRQFIKSIAALPFALSMPSGLFALATAQWKRLLILIELKGGNDGLNTLVPFSSETYYQLRPQLGIARDQVIQLTQTVGLNPSLAPLKSIWDKKELAIIQGVGYDKPNLSHFRSIEIWDTASDSEDYLPDGWLARAFMQQQPPASYAANGVIVGSQELGPLIGDTPKIVVVNNPRQFVQRAKQLQIRKSKSHNAALNHILQVETDLQQAANQLVKKHGLEYPFKTNFPSGPFGRHVETAAQLIAANSGIAVLRLTHDGFDNHRNQQFAHNRLLRELAEGLASLKGALQELSMWDSSMIMTYSEFGRRPKQNASSGTDHGTANTHFVTGGRVRGGLYGRAPQLNDLVDNNLKHSIDFRSLYATALESWWKLDANNILGGKFTKLDILKT